MAKSTKATPVQEVDDDEVELEELTEDADDEDEAPAKGKKAAKAAPKEEVFGVRALIALVKEKTGTEYKPREVRTLLRKMAREDGTIDREIIAGNKARYEWEGPNDPEVKAFIKQVKSGAIEAAKKAALDKLKADKAAQTAAKQAAAAKAEKKAKKAPAPPVDEDDDDED